jgi:hypothetical protein
MSDDESVSMRRTAGVSYEPDDRVDVLDFVADYALDAADAGVHPQAVATALRDAADEVEYQNREDNIDAWSSEEPQRSEPADMGGGETTGVQDL